MTDVSIQSDETAGEAGTIAQSTVGDFVQLLKPRVMSLVVFTAFAGLFLAPGDLHPVLAGIAILCIAVGAGASGAINMWYDRDIDAIMLRTRNRPIPRGVVQPEDALTFGVMLSVASVTLMGLCVNWMAGGLLAFTILFYVVIYTAWLKRRTPQNIVIGGAAGALPPVVGWAAVTGDVSLAGLGLFLIIFMWTPPHFWALSLYRQGDYAAAGVPMLPVVAGQRSTRRHILFYAILLAPLTLLPCADGTAGWIYGAVAAASSCLFILMALRVWRLQEGKPGADQAARHLFSYSILYLFILFATLIAERMLGMS